MKRTSRRSRYRKLGRAARWGALVGILGIVALWLCRHTLIQTFVVPRLEQLLAAELGLDVTIGDLKLDLTGRVTVSQFRATGGTPRTPLEGIAVRRVQAEVSVLRLLGGDEGWFEKVEVVEPRVVVRVSGEPPQEEEDRDIDLEEGSGLGFRLPGLRLLGGRVVLRDGERSLLLKRVSVDHEGGEVHVTVGEALGDWEVPRLAELDLPLRLRTGVPGLQPHTSQTQSHQTRRHRIRRNLHC